ncbi:hypothetical protein Tco_1259979, partial [Tanacetum coccineum]
KNFSGKVTPLFDSMLVQQTEDEGEASERPSDTQPIPSPPHRSEDQPKTLTDSSPRPSPSIAIPDSNPEGSGGNHGGQSSTQAKEIKALKAQVKKLKKGVKPLITHHKAWMKTRLVRKTSLNKKGVHKEYVSKQGRKSIKFFKGKPSAHKDPAFDDLDDFVDVDDTLDYIEFEDAQNEGRTSSVVLEEKESTDKKNDGTDKQNGGTYNTKVSTDRQDEGTADQDEGKSVTQTTLTPTSTPTPIVFGDDETIAQVLITMSQNKEKLKEKLIQKIKAKRGLKRKMNLILNQKDGTIIYMLVEKRYPLSKELLQQIIDLGLEVKEESTDALQLGSQLTLLHSKELASPGSNSSWLSIHLVVYNEELAIPEQTATGKGISNPLMAEEDKRIAEDQAAKDRYWKIPICYDNDDGEESSIPLKDIIISGLPSCVAITPILVTEEPVESLIMEDEHLDTILATESDEVIKSSVENLVQILSESEGILDNMCDVPFRDNSTPLDISKDQFEGFFDSNNDSTSIDDDSFSIDDINYVEASPPDSELVSLEEVKDFYTEDGEIKDNILREILLKINLLIAKIKAINSNPPLSSDFVTKSSSTSLNFFLEETNTFDNSIPESETFCFDLEENSSGSTTTRSDYSLPDYEAFYFDDDHIEEKSSGSTTTHSDISLSKYDSFIFDLSNDPFPPADRSDFYHEKFADELAHIISLPDLECVYFKSEL